MKKTNYAIALFIITIFFACKKDSSTDNTSCEKENYGTLKVDFGSGTTKHSILVFIGAVAREKTIIAGKLSDTMHLAPSSYSVIISSVTDNGTPIELRNATANITVCGEDTESVPF